MADIFQLTEPIVQALVARFQDPAQLNAQIAEIAARCSRQDEALSLTPVDADRVFDFVPPPSYLTAFPTVGIQDTRSVLEDDTGHSATGKHTMGIVVFCSDPDQHLLAWQLRRYVQAITRTVLAERRLEVGGETAAWGVGFDSVAWGPTFESIANPGTWMSWALVQIWARREEL